MSKKITKQLRLDLPVEWIPPLTELAAEEGISRVGVIRSALRQRLRQKSIQQRGEEGPDNVKSRKGVTRDETH